MKKNQQNKANSFEHFPELHCPQLERYAQRWAKRYKGIQRICLHNYLPERFDLYRDIMPGFAVRYALVFELSTEIEQEALQELERATEQNETIHQGYPALFDNRFFTLYKEKPENDFPKHWVMLLKKAEGQMPLGVVTDEPYWVLWESVISGDVGDSSETIALPRVVTRPSDLPAELFPALNPVELTKRVWEWVDRWPLIDDVRLYAGKSPSTYVLVFTTGDKKALSASGFWDDSLIPLQQDLQTVYRDPERFHLSQWTLIVLADNEEPPAGRFNPNCCWNLLWQVLPVTVRPNKAETVLSTERDKGMVFQESVSRDEVATDEEIDSVETIESPDITHRGKYFFVREGEFWNVGFGDEKGNLRNLKSIQYIVHLLKQPWTPIDVTQLRALITKTADGTALYGRETEAELRKQGQSLSDFAEEQWNEDGMTLGEVGTDILTEKEREILGKTIETILDNLEAAKKAGNPGRLAKANEEIEKFRSYCLEAYALKTWIKEDNFVFSTHQMKRLNPSRERDRQNVKNQIKKGLNIIRKTERFPKLYEHLDKYINGGETYSYDPAPEDQLDWWITGV